MFYNLKLDDIIRYKLDVKNTYVLKWWMKLKKLLCLKNLGNNVMEDLWKILTIKLFFALLEEITAMKISMLVPGIKKILQKKNDNKENMSIIRKTMDSC